MINLVDKNTDVQSLVGRYIVRNAGLSYGAVDEPRKVISAISKTLMVVDVPRAWSKHDKRWVIGAGGDMAQQGGNPMPPVALRSVYMACDTLDELDSMMRISWESERLYHLVCKDTHATLKALAGRLDVLDPTEAEAVIRP